ncbi:MAG: PRC-barrel domain-containing protein [Rhodospirillaceae bacterium]
MRTLMIATAALAATVVAGGAQADQHGAAGDAGAQTTTTVVTDQQAAAPVDGFELIGKKVVGQNGDDVGTIKNVIVDTQGQPSHVVLGHGGWLGMGEKEIALGFDQLQVSSEEIRVSLTDEQLTNMAEYESRDERVGDRSEAAPLPQTGQAPDTTATTTAPTTPNEPANTVPGAVGTGDQPAAPRAAD